jgi:hypothetical protein
VTSDNNVWKHQQPGENVVGNDQTRAIFEKDFLFLFVNIQPQITDLAARSQLIIRRTLIPSSLKLLGESPYRPVATVTECPSLRRACAIAWVAVAAPPPA